jgi:hypothetical protein
VAELECRPVTVDVDGEQVTVVVRGAGPPAPEEEAALVELVRAVRHLQAQRAAADPDGEAEREARAVAARRRNHARMHRLRGTDCTGCPDRGEGLQTAGQRYGDGQVSNTRSREIAMPSDIEVLHQLAERVRDLIEVDIRILHGQLTDLLPDDQPWDSQQGRLVGGICGHAHRLDPSSHDPIEASDRVFAAGPAATADLIEAYAAHLEAG